MRYRPIRRNSEFGRVYARGKSYVNPASGTLCPQNPGPKTRVGLTATKKIGHAVQRNRARRVMKAAIDEHLDYNIGGYDLIFVARGHDPPRLKSWQLSSVVAKLFAQAGLPDKAKRPDAKPPATVPPGTQAQAEKPRRMNRPAVLPQRAVRAHPPTSIPSAHGSAAAAGFTPSCSNYATMQAIMTHGCVKGILLGAWRIARCNPFGKWGFDPVPEPGRWQTPPAGCSPQSCFLTRHRVEK